MLYSEDNNQANGSTIIAIYSEDSNQSKLMVQNNNCRNTLFKRKQSYQSSK